jgi:hypothetical protein
MTNSQLPMTNQCPIAELPNCSCAGARAGSRLRPSLARTQAATGVRHGKDANHVAERR